ncbi:MAG: sugar transferase [Anaerolineae bacterium]|nr:sugar transferase [Anaerolineae bacterium]
MHQPKPAQRFQANFALKRLFDIAVSAAALLALTPVFFAIGVAIQLTSPGPVLYKAKRVGLNGKPFTLYKFRSMIVSADKVGPRITAGSDTRVTPIGRVLRRTKMDELPQLLNVLKGDMSLVGPRPEDPTYVQKYTPEQRRILDVKPGITSPASVEYRNEEAILQGPDWEHKYLTEVMPAKLKLDMDYAKDPSVDQDIRIILKTVQRIFS